MAYVEVPLQYLLNAITYACHYLTASLKHRSYAAEECLPRFTVHYRYLYRKNGDFKKMNNLFHDSCFYFTCYQVVGLK